MKSSTRTRALTTEAHIQTEPERLAASLEALVRSDAWQHITQVLQERERSLLAQIIRVGANDHERSMMATQVREIRWLQGVPEQEAHRLNTRKAGAK